MITIGKLDEHKMVVAKRLIKKLTGQGMRVMYDEPEHHKLSFHKELEANRSGRVHLCKAACFIAFRFAACRLNAEERIIPWHSGKLYIAAPAADNCCSRLNQKTYLCAVAEHRRLIYTGFGCASSEDGKCGQTSTERTSDPELIQQMSKGNSGFYTHSKQN